ncbi:MAG: hypothetical protein JWR85_2614 [Marmoricola sp.]|nr:hypothetical protein [Marmoricola sp.]
MRIFHIATVADWERARQSGAYRTSTVGRTLEDEGFLHAAHRQQVAGVFQRYYREIGVPLVLLTIDTDRLGVPWREDAVGDQTFPHIYGPLSPEAVVGVQPLDKNGGTHSFTSLFFTEMSIRFLLAFLAMLLAFVGSLAGRQVDSDWAEFTGALVGFLVGGVLATIVLRRRGRWSALRSRSRA